MPVRTRSQVEDDHRRWRNLCGVAARLATQRGRRVLAVRHPRRWLQQRGRVHDDEIVVTWTVVDAEILRHELGLSTDRVLAAAPRVRYARTGIIPAPRRRSDP